MFEVKLSPLELDPQSGLSRAALRPQHLRQPGYEQEFDHSTILYDLFWSFDGREVVGIGPPLANLADPILSVLRRGLRGGIFSRLEQRNLERCWEVWIRRCRAHFADDLSLDHLQTGVRGGTNAPGSSRQSPR